MTDQYVIGVEGKAEKKIQFNHCSNSRITEACPLLDAPKIHFALTSDAV